MKWVSWSLSCIWGSAFSAYSIKHLLRKYYHCLILPELNRGLAWSYLQQASLKFETIIGFWVLLVLLPVLIFMRIGLQQKLVEKVHCPVKIISKTIIASKNDLINFVTISPNCLLVSVNITYTNIFQFLLPMITKFKVMA